MTKIALKLQPRKKRLQRAVGEGARQQRVRIEYHLGEGKPKELFLLFH